MDVTFKTEEGIFNYRVCAIIINNGKLLVMKDERSPYYYLPGGRVKLHETAENAILREMKEELNIEATIERPLWLNQSFFVEDVNKEKYHEICLYYLVNINKTEFPVTENIVELYEKNKKLVFEWLQFEELEKSIYIHILSKKQYLKFQIH